MLTGKTAVVTGAARGLGRAIAARFAAEGADLVLLDICRDIPTVPYPLGTRDQLERTAELCRDNGAAVLTLTADIREWREADSVAQATVERFGRIDILVNNAGIAAPSGRPVQDIDEGDWDVMLDVNLSGPWRMIKAVSAAMARQRDGSIINVSSTGGLVGFRHLASYVAAKHGLIGLTRAAALDLASMKIRVNAICPGSVRDDPALDGRMLAEIGHSLGIPRTEQEETFLRAQPTHELVEAQDVAEAALWLAGDGSRRVTGSAVTVDGGFTAR
jgi:NAD(P)-dependent dehydrogenase (short-subunit alcohol dehydrogenase family)